MSRNDDTSFGGSRTRRPLLTIVSGETKGHLACADLGFPHLILCWSPESSQRIPIRVGVGSPSLRLSRNDCEFQTARPLLANGTLHPLARPHLIAQVRFAVLKLGVRMCIVWSPGACTYVEAEKHYTRHALPSGDMTVSLDVNYQCAADPERCGLMDKYHPSGEFWTPSQFTLSSGRGVWMHDFHMSSTSGENTPSVEYADQDAQRALDALEKLWGKRATYLIPPANGTYAEHEGKRRLFALLPGQRYHAWLTSDPLTLEYTSSGLVVIWFAHYPQRPLVEFVADAVRDVPWEEHAHDFDY